jgi:hypothetical protein
VAVTDDLHGDDLQWRRPPEGAAPTPGRPPEQAGEAPETPAPYTGPPRTIRPPRGWRPKLLVQAPPPRKLPDQDMEALDSQEREARTVTYGIGMVAAAVLLIVLLILCGRALF